MQPYELTATEASALIAAKKLSCEELARSVLGRIAEREPLIRAWSYVDPDRIVRSARELDKRPPAGPLRNLTFGVKDMIDTADMPTQHNSPIYFRLQPALDAACVAVARRGGGLIVGKTGDRGIRRTGCAAAATRTTRTISRFGPGGCRRRGRGRWWPTSRCNPGRPARRPMVRASARPRATASTASGPPTAPSAAKGPGKAHSYTLDTVGWYGRISVEDAPTGCRRAFRLRRVRVR